MKIFVAGGTGVIGRPLMAKLLANGHAVVALTRSSEQAPALVERGIEPAIADVFDKDATFTRARMAPCVCSMAERSTTAADSG